jgi:hypothetical protein
LKLTRAAWVSGCVRGVDGAPRAGLAISDLTEGTSTLTDPTGCYRLGPLAPGEHSLMGLAEAPVDETTARKRARRVRIGAPEPEMKVCLADGEERRIDVPRPAPPLP